MGGLSRAGNPDDLVAALADEATPRRCLRDLSGLEASAVASVAVASVAALMAVVAEAGSVADGVVVVSEEAATSHLAVSGTGSVVPHQPDPAASTDATVTGASRAVGMTREMEDAHLTTDAAVVVVSAMAAAAAVGTVIARTV